MKNKEYMSKDEKIKRGLKIFGIAFLAVVVLAVVIGVAATSITEARKKDRMDLTDELEKMYISTPWDGKEGELDYSGNVWEYYRMMMLADREASYEGYEGYQFDGEIVCVDLSKLSEEDQPAVKEMMTDYLTLRGLKYRFNSKKELKEMGLIDESNRDTYKEGCILTFSELREQPEGFIEADIEFYYSEYSFNIMNIGIFSEECWQEYAESRFYDQITKRLSKDSVLYRRELLNGKTDDTFVLTAAGKKVYCISTMTG